MPALSRPLVGNPEYSARLELAKFLRSLTEHMTRPVMPDNEAMDYLPTQATADSLSTGSELELDGILFSSVQAESQGKNVLLFHEAALVDDMRPVLSQADCFAHSKPLEGLRRQSLAEQLLGAFGAGVLVEPFPCLLCSQYDRPTIVHVEHASGCIVRDHAKAIIIPWRLAKSGELPDSGYEEYAAAFGAEVVGLIVLLVLGISQPLIPSVRADKGAMRPYRSVKLAGCNGIQSSIEIVFRSTRTSPVWLPSPSHCIEHQPSGFSMKELGCGMRHDVVVLERHVVVAADDVLLALQCSQIVRYPLVLSESPTHGDGPSVEVTLSG